MGQSRLQPIFLVYFQYKTTQSILFTTSNSVYCLSNIVYWKEDSISFYSTRFIQFQVLLNFNRISSGQSIFILRLIFVQWQYCGKLSMYSIRFFCCMYMTKNDYFFIPCSHSSMLYHIFRGNTLQIKEKENFFFFTFLLCSRVL